MRKEREKGSGKEERNKGVEEKRVRAVEEERKGEKGVGDELVRKRRGNKGRGIGE